MATNSIEIISVEQMAGQLRIPKPTDEEKVLIEMAINAGVSRVIAYTGVPLLDTAVAITVPTFIVYVNEPVALNQRHIKAIDSVKYWAAGKDLREEPGNEIAVDTLGRLESTRDGKSLIYPPAAGWPVTEAFIFSVTVGLDITPNNEVFRFGCILAAREAHEGRLDSDFVNNSFRVLLAPLRDWVV